MTTFAHMRNHKRHQSGVIRYAVVLAVVTASLSACDDGGETPPSVPDTVLVQEAVKHKLEQLRADVAPMGDFKVEYNDMHSFHGGETLTVTGSVLTGRYLFRGVGRTQIEPPPTSLTVAQLTALIDLLLEIEAWDQRVPARTAVLDESSTSLTISVGELHSSIWEWYNDLNGNDRMVRVKQMLEEIAGPVSND